MIFGEIAKATARLLDKEKVALYFDSPAGAEDGVRREAELVARCVNLTIAQTAAEYAPFRAEKVVEAENGVIALDTFEENVTEILFAEDEAGNRLRIRRGAGYIRTVPGKIRVTYAYLPEKFSAADEVVFSDRRVSEGLIAYGAAAEYCLVAGLFDEAVVWNERYADCVKKTLLGKNKIIAERAWI